MALDVEIERGWKLLEDDAVQLQRDGWVAAKFFVESDGGTTILVAPEAELLDSPDLKDLLAERVRQTVEEIGAHTVYNVSDAWTSDVRDASLRPELIEWVMQNGIKRAGEMGLVERREALMCSITTRRGDSALLRWFYRRDEKDRITMEERNLIPKLAEGRFSKLFPEKTK